MAASMNSVNVIGNLTKDPETREAGSTTVTQLRIAVNDRRKVDGEWTDVAGFYDVDVWGAQGENCAKFLSRGRPVGISGRLQWREWETDNGKRQAVSIVAESVQFLGGKDDSDSAPSGDRSRIPQ